MNHTVVLFHCCTAAGDREGGPPGGPPPRGPAYPPIGLAAAQHSAVQVSQLLGGTPASDRRIQDQLNDLLGSKSRAELWEVMRMLKDLFGGDRNAAKAWFAERPGLSKAVFQAQVLLGEWSCMCSCQGCLCGRQAFGGVRSCTVCPLWAMVVNATLCAGGAHINISQLTT
jgi:hypothetical protein